MATKKKQAENFGIKSGEVLTIQATILSAVFDSLDTGEWSQGMLDDLPSIKEHILAGIALTDIELTAEQAQKAASIYDELCGQVAQLGSLGTAGSTGTWAKFSHSKSGMN